VQRRLVGNVDGHPGAGQRLEAVAAVVGQFPADLRDRRDGSVRFVVADERRRVEDPHRSTTM
jgi:hypothetical protein